MRVLIAYDGSEEAKRAIESLPCSEWPEQAEAMVVASVQVWPPLPSSCFRADMCPATRLTRMAHTLANLAVLEPQSIARQGAELLTSKFPRWAVTVETCLDPSPAAFLQKAEDWRADRVLTSDRDALPIGERSKWLNLHDGRVTGMLLDRVNAAWGALLLRLGYESYEALMISGTVEAVTAVA